MLKDNRKYTYLFAALFIPYILFCFYAYPVGDDFNYCNKSAGWVNAQVHNYFFWGGRYISNALAYPFSTHSLLAYRLIALGIIILTPASAFFAISSVSSKAFAFKEKILSALLFSVLQFGIMPSLTQGIYWMSGSVTYQLGSIVSMFYIGFGVSYVQEKFILNKTVHFLFSILFLFLSLGFNEVLTLMLLAAHFIVWLNLPIEKRFRLPLFLFAIFTLLFSLIMILAPGNSVRSGFFSTNHNLLYSLSMTTLQIVRFFAKWVFFPPLMLTSLLVIGQNGLFEQSSLLQKLSSLKPWKIFLILLLILFLCIFPPYWNTGILGQHRTLNAACFFFIPAWLVFVRGLSIRYNLAGRLVLLTTKTKHFIILLIAASSLLAGNSGRAIAEFSKGEITGFANDMHERFTLIENAKQKGVKEISVPLLRHHPSSLFVLDIQPDCSHWINNDYAIYFDVEKVCMDTLGTK